MLALAFYLTLCGPNNYYDPGHQICAPSPPAYPQPGYDQSCGDNGFYDPVHQVCTSYPPAYLPPFYSTS
jgi:hypothetical protein